MAASTLRQRPMELAGDDIEIKAPYNISEQGNSKHDYGAETPDNDGNDDVWGDSRNDMRDMLRLGKKQEFKRNFGLLSALGFVSVYMATWEFVLVSLSIGFTNGGFAGLFWCFITTVICYATIVASLAEMESMAPTSGGQYHWVSGMAFIPSTDLSLLTMARICTSSVPAGSLLRFRMDVNARMASQRRE